MDLRQIDDTLRELEGLFEAAPDDREDFDEELCEVANMDREAFLALLSKRAATPYGRAFARLRELVVNELVVRYRGASPPEREALLSMIARHPKVGIEVWSLLAEHRWRLQKASRQEAPSVLETTLTLAVLAEKYLDAVETAHLLTSVWGDAESAGLDPAAAFRRAAEIAGTHEITRGLSASDLLRDFEPYDYGARRGS